MNTQITPIEFFVNRIYIDSDINTPTDFVEKYNLRKKCREIDILMLRQVLVYHLHLNTTLTLNEIGKIVGQKHANIIHTIKVVENYIEAKDKFYVHTKKKYENEINGLRLNF